MYKTCWHTYNYNIARPYGRATQEREKNMRKVSFAWKGDSLVVERTADNGYSRKEYQAGDLVCRLASTIGDARREFIDFLNATIPEKDTSVMIINGQRAVIYGIASMRISVIYRYDISAHCGDMPSTVARIIRNESGKTIMVLV